MSGACSTLLHSDLSALLANLLRNRIRSQYWNAGLTVGVTDGTWRAVGGLLVAETIHLELVVHQGQTGTHAEHDGQYLKNLERVVHVDGHDLVAFRSIFVVKLWWDI